MALFSRLPNGGLPKGISELTCITYVPSSNQESTVTIPHGLSRKPNFCMLALENDISTAVLNSQMVFCYIFDKTVKTDRVSTSEPIETSVSIMGYSPNYLFSNYNYTSKDILLNETDIIIPFVSGYPLKKGYTYKLVCGLVDDVAGN